MAILTDVRAIENVVFTDVVDRSFFPFFIEQTIISYIDELRKNISKQVLGVENFSPELALPIEVQYQSTSEQTGMLGYRWLYPQLESRVFPQNTQFAQNTQFTPNTQSPPNLQFNKNTAVALRNPPNSLSAIAATNSAPATVNWRTPWGETIAFIRFLSPVDQTAIAETIANTDNANNENVENYIAS